MSDDIVITAKTGTHPALPDVSHNAMTQVAPYPWALAKIVGRHSYKPGWDCWLEDCDRGQGSQGLTLFIKSSTPDSRTPGASIKVHHLFPVPPAAYNERSWRRWLFERYLEVEQHEAQEFFRLDGRLPFAPLHAPGNDPYMVIEATEEEEHTDNRGRVNVRQTIRTETGAIIGTRDTPTTWAEIASGTWHQHSMPDGSIIINHSEKPPPGAVHSAPIDAEALRRFGDPESLGKRPKGWGE